MAATTLMLASASIPFGGAQVASSIDQRKAAKRAERRQRRANEIEQARASVERAIERKRAIGQARQAQAINIAQAAAQGLDITESSPLLGAQSSLFSNLNTSLASQNRAAFSGQETFDLRQRASFSLQNAQANAAVVNALSQAVTNTALAVK